MDRVKELRVLEREAEQIRQHLTRIGSIQVDAPTFSSGMSFNYLNTLTHINQVDGYLAPPSTLLPNTVNPALISADMGASVPTGMSFNYFNTLTHIN
jgi:hypothetical protein